MTKKTIVPFGPQHPVLPEPLHFDLYLEDELVVDAVPMIGYIHRGLEYLAPERDFTEFVYIAERICGICSFIHGMGYCQAVEAAMNIDLPPRAQWLRVFWSELSRVHSHLLWLGLAADAFGYESLFMHTWRLRETILDIFEETTGGRVIFGVCKVGGSRKDITDEMFTKADKAIDSITAQLKTLCNVFLKDASVVSRLKGVGVLSYADAMAYGAVGPMARASGVAQDLRMLNYAAYGEVDFEPITATAGDCLARVEVRVGEVFQSIDIIKQAMKKIPQGPVDVKVTGMPNGEYFSRLEQPRGEVIYYVRGNGTKQLDRVRVRTPTFANIPAMIHVIKGSHLADVPNIILTIDPCISCTER